MENRVLITSLNEITVEKLIKVLKEVESDTKICIDILGDNFHIKVIEECSYYSWGNGKKVQADKGILIRQGEANMAKRMKFLRTDEVTG